MTWCNESALINCSEDCDYVTNDPGNTGLTGIKFDKGYNDSESRIVWFKLLGDWTESDMVYVCTLMVQSTYLSRSRTFVITTRIPDNGAGFTQILLQFQ